jgi:hypothetical protein
VNISEGFELYPSSMAGCWTGTTFLAVLSFGASFARAISTIIINGTKFYEADTGNQFIVKG